RIRSKRRVNMEVAVTPASTHAAAAAEWIQEKAPSKLAVHRGLLVVTVAASILSLIPPLRLLGAMITRSVALLSSTLHCADKGSKDHLFTRVARVGAVAVGLAALVVASPVMLVASLAADIGLQAIEMVRAFRRGEIGKGLAHL